MMSGAKQPLIDRGLSYIAGVRLLFETMGVTSAISKLDALQTDYNPESKHDLYALLHSLQELVKKQDLLKVKNLEKAHKLIVDWEAISAAQNYSKAGKEEGGEKSKYQLMRDLQNAEIAESSHLKRQDFMVTTLTADQEEEWLSILGGSQKISAELSYVIVQPKWFLQLDSTIQKFYIQQVRAYQEKIAAYDSHGTEKKPNLGDYIGFQPATVRKTPGSANCWAQKTTDSAGKVSYKVRSAYVVPCDMFKGRRLFSNTGDIVKATADNIKQQIALALYLKMAEKIENKEEPTIKDFTFLLQNFISLPVQPGVMPGIRGTYALYAAIDYIKKELASSAGREGIFKLAQQFSHEELGVPQDNKETIKRQLDASKKAKVDLVFSHHAVNKIRGISTALMSIPEGYRWLKSRIKGTESLADKIADIKRSIQGLVNKTYDDQKILAAIAQHESIHYSTSTFAGLVKSHKWNTNAERAALEQIIMQHTGAGKDYARGGSCVSGKDREEMVGLIKLAMEEIYKETGGFPLAPGKTESQEIRVKFENRVAELFVKKYGPMIADMNAPGSDGLKNILDVLGKSVCEKIDEKAKQKDLGDNFCKRLQKAADTNKVKFKKTAAKVVDGKWNTNPLYTSPDDVRQQAAPASEPEGVLPRQQAEWHDQPLPVQRVDQSKKPASDSSMDPVGRRYSVDDGTGLSTGPSQKGPAEDVFNVNPLDPKAITPGKDASKQQQPPQASVVNASPAPDATIGRRPSMRKGSSGGAQT